MRRLRALFIAAAAVMAMGSAADPREQLADPQQEARARGLFREIRCLVCQNESIDDSTAPLAADLRRVVRQEIAAGRSSSEIKAFLTERYGEFVLFRPRFSAGNAILWVAPFAVVVIGLAGALALRRRNAVDQPLNAEEEALVSSLTREGDSVTVPPHARQTNALDG